MKAALLLFVTLAICGCSDSSTKQQLDRTEKKVDQLLATEEAKVQDREAAARIKMAITDVEMEARVAANNRDFYKAFGVTNNSLTNGPYTLK